MRCEFVQYGCNSQGYWPVMTLIVTLNETWICLHNTAQDLFGRSTAKNLSTSQDLKVQNKCLVQKSDFTCVQPRIPSLFSAAVVAEEFEGTCHKCVAYSTCPYMAKEVISFTMLPLTDSPLGAFPGGLRVILACREQST